MSHILPISLLLVCASGCAAAAPSVRPAGPATFAAPTLAPAAGTADIYFTEDEERLILAVRQALLSEPDLAVVADTLAIEAHGTTVVLRGNLRSPEQAALAEQVASQVVGVQKVRGELAMDIGGR